MRRARLRWIVAAMLALASLAAGARAQPYCCPTDWETAFEPSMEAAHRAGRPVVLYFGLAFDATTHEALVRLRRDPDLVRAMHRFVRIYLDEGDLGVAYGRYRVTELPAIAVLDPDGRKVALITPDPDTDAWMEELKVACAQAMSRAICVMEPPPPPAPTYSCVPPRPADPPQPAPMPPPPKARIRFKPKKRTPKEKARSAHARPHPAARPAADRVGPAGSEPPGALRAGGGDIRWPPPDTAVR